MFRRIKHQFGAGGRARETAVPERVTAIRSSVGQFADPTDIVLRGIQAELASEKQAAAELDRRRHDRAR